MSNKLDRKEANPEMGIGQATPEQIAAWKAMYGGVNEIKVKGKYYCYLRPFDRATIKYALSQITMKIDTEKKEADMDMSKIIDLGEVALQNCWIGGSDEIKTNDVMWISAAMQAGELMEMDETELKKY